MRFGRICVQNDELNCNFKGRGPSTGSWNGAMGFRAEFVIALLKVPGFPAGGSFLRRTDPCWGILCVSDSLWIQTGGFDCPGAKGGERMFSQDTSFSGEFVQQWKLGMRAREAALNGVADSKLRRLLAYNKSSDCAEIAVGDSVRFLKLGIVQALPAGVGPRRFWMPRKRV